MVLHRHHKMMCDAKKTISVIGGSLIDMVTATLAFVLQAHFHHS
jgi:hypothetical protein